MYLGFDAKKLERLDEGKASKVDTQNAYPPHETRTHS